MCGWTLARAHARSGHRIAIASYLGMSDRFDQSRSPTSPWPTPTRPRRDYETVLKAIKDGKIPVESGI